MSKNESDLNKEIDELAEKMSKATVTEDEARESLFNTILELGPEGLKKKLPDLNEDQRELLKSCLEDFAKAGGEGSRGGKVVGHSKSGQPIYEHRVAKLVPEAEGSEHGHIHTDTGHSFRGKVSSWKVGDKVAPIEITGMHHGMDSKSIRKAEKEKEAPEVEMPAKQAVKEHKRLVNVLESESHKDDKEEAKKQKKELKEYEGKMEKANPKVEDEKTPKQETTDANKMRAEALSGSDDQDEKKLMDDKNASHSNQGGPKDKPEGWEGQMIKSHDDKKEKAMDKLVQIEEAEHNKDIDGDGKIAEKLEKEKKMKKALEEIVAIAKSKKMTKEQVVKAIKDSGEDLEKAKQKLLKEEDQSEFKPQDESQKEKIDESKGDLEIKAEQKADEVKVIKKSVVWNPKNSIGANTLGRNTHYDVDAYIEKSEADKQEIIKKGGYFGETEPLKKSETPKADINDLIEKGMDYSTEEIKRLEGIRDHKVEGRVVKSFHDRDIAAALGMSEEEYKKLMGE